MHFSVFSSVVSSRAAVLLDFSSNVLYEPISRYGKLGFQSFGVVLAVLEWVTDCMDKSFVLVWLNALYAWLVRYTWLLQWRTVARPVNLAQASQSRLGEMKQGARLGLLHERSPRRPARTFERGNTSPRREGSRLSEIPWCSLSAPSNPRLGEGGLTWASTSRLSKTPQPERGSGRGSALFGCLFILGWLILAWVWIVWWGTCI